MSLFSGCVIECYLNGAWVDLTSRLVGTVTISQGRPTEFDDITPGTLTCTLANDDGALMPDNTASGYFPFFKEETQIRWKVTKSAVTYTRFWGWVKAIVPTFPTAFTVGATVSVTAIDNLGVCAGVLLYSSWLHTIKYNSEALSVRWDGFSLKGGDGNATAYLDNVTNSTGSKARATIVAATGGVGEMTFGGAEGLSIDGSMTFNPAENRFGAVVKVDTPNAIRGVNFFVRFPNTVQTQAGNAQRDVITFYDGGGAVLAKLRISFNAGTSKDDLVWQSAANATITTIYTNVSENRWCLVNIETLTATPTTTRCGYEANFNDYAGFDLRNVRALWFGGIGTVVPQMEIAGLALSGSENGISYIKMQGLTAGTGGNLTSRIVGMDYAVPVTLYTAAGGDYSTLTLTGNWHGRPATEVMQEQMRTGAGFYWAKSWDSTVTAVAGNLTYPATSVVTLDCEADLGAPPELIRAVDTRPTRIVSVYPAGQATVVDVAAETAANGQRREIQLNSLATTYTAAETLATNQLAKVALGTRISKLVIDLETAANDPTAALFNSTGLGGLFPTQRVTVTVPASHFGVTSKDVHIEGWVETYDGTDGCSITCDCSPAYTPGGGGGGSTVTVDNPGAQSWTVGTPVSLTITGSSTAGGALTYSATGLPAGLSIASGGLISGTPTTASSGSVTVTGTDITSNTGNAVFSWTVSAGGTPPAASNDAVMTWGG